MWRCSSSKPSRTSAAGAIMSEMTTRPPGRHTRVHLRDRALRVGEVVQRAAAHDEVERTVDEGERRRVALLESSTFVSPAPRTRRRPPRAARA